MSPFNAKNILHHPIRCGLGMVAVLVLLGSGICFGQEVEPSRFERDITQVLTKQSACWNAKDIDGFMQTYWKSEKLTFSGGGKTTRGWEATRNRYKAKYPPEKMGNLTFDHLEVTALGEASALVLGDWHLDVNGKKADGNFSLVLRKWHGAWKIIHDHSSSLEKDKVEN